MSIIAALTVGVILSVFIGVASLMNALVSFPIQVYRNLREQERVRRLSRLFIPSPPPEPLEEDIWDRHIRRMEEKKEDGQED